MLFLATPHAGSALASLVNEFRRIFGATVAMEDLRAHDAHLRDLFDWYRQHSNEITTATYYESRDFQGVRIVNPTSSHPGIGKDPIPLDEDHSSIAKPQDRKSRVYSAAADLVQGCIVRTRPRRDKGAAEPSAASLMTAAPHELPPAAEEFFGRETELRKLTERLQARKNTAVVGGAGMGKTALAAKAVRAVTGNSVGELANSPYRDGVLYVDLYRARGAAEAVWKELADKLAGTSFLKDTPRPGARPPGVRGPMDFDRD